MTEIKVDIKFRISGKLKNDFGSIQIGKYTFSKIPSNLKDNSELILSFRDVWKEGQIHSNPEKEAEIILSWLSVILRQRVKFDSGMLNNINNSKENKEKIVFSEEISFQDNITELYTKLKSLPYDEDNKLLDKYIRACECYQDALFLSSENPGISFFLFVVSIECLSDKNNNFYEHLMNEIKTTEQISKKEIEEVYKKYNENFGSHKQFIKFIIENFDEWKQSFSEDEFKKLLSSIYSIRSTFTHTGEDLKKYIELIDNTLKSKTVFTRIGDKNLEFPGLNYLSHLVGSVLINFLNSKTPSEKDNIPQLASDSSLVNLVATTEVKAHTSVTSNQIKHRK